MRATHTSYLHPNHLRVVEDNGDVMCYAPSCSTYSKLNKPNLPKWKMPEPSNKEMKGI